MSSIRKEGIKTILIKQNRSKKGAPYWVKIGKTNKKVSGSPKSNRHWRKSKIF